MNVLLQFLRGKNSVRGATALLVVTLTASNILGLFRDRFLAAKIPASQLDLYYAAFRLPDLITNLIVIGAIAVVFIPVFTEIRSRSEKQAWEAASAILNSTIVVLVIAAAFLAIFMPWLMPLIVPDFDPIQLTQTVYLARLLCITPVLFGVSYVLSGVLNSYHRFTIYSFAPLVYNGSIILTTIFFGDRYGVNGVVVGVVVGAFLHMAIQIPVVWHLGWQWRPAFTIQHPAVRRIGTLMVPRTIGLFATQFVGLVSTAVASSWTGAITYYSLANNIQTVPTVIFANSIATAVFPAISAAAASDDLPTFRRHVTQGIRWILFLLIPSSIGLILLRVQVIRLLFGAGYFGWEATQTTADVLGWFALSIVASGLIPLLARAFYARQDTRTPMHIALISALITIILCLQLPGLLPATVTLGGSHVLHLGEVAGLAIAVSVGSWVNAVLLIRAMTRQIQIPLSAATGSLAKILLATLVMAVVIQLSKTYLGAHLDLSYARNVLLQTLVPLVLAVVSYATIVWQLGCPEWHELLSLRGKNNSTETSTQPA